MTTTKPFEISKRRVLEAYRHVRANRGAAGIDDESIEMFEVDLSRNLYMLWNRMASGSYFPPPVKQVEIAKKSGNGKRLLGIPTVADRIGQQVVKARIEGGFEELFHPDSYGYRLNKSAADAVAVTRERCWKYDWCVEFDICRAFDELDWDLMRKVISKHVKDPWALLYIEEIRRGVLQGQQSARALPPDTVYVPGVYVPAEASPRPRREVLDELPACGKCSGDEADVSTHPRVAYPQTNLRRSA